MIKNTSGQSVGVQMVSASDGSAFTGAVTVAVTVDAGTQATGTVGSGACTHEGNGYHTYAPSQAETNGDLVAFTFTGTGAVPQTVQIYTRAATPNVNVSTITNGAITAAAIATDAIDADALAADAIAEINATVDQALADYDPPTKAELDAAVANVSVDEIQATALADLFNTDSGTTYASAVAGSVVKEIADNAGGSSLTAADIADAVWEEAIADHSGTSGSTAEALAAAQSAGDPWSTALPGAYGAGTAGNILGNNLDATVSSRASQASVNTVDDFLDTEIAAILDAVDTEVAAIKAKTDNLPDDPADASVVAGLIAGVDGKIDTIDTNVDAILVDTTEIGAAGAGLSAIPWNAAWDDEVQSEATDALNAYDPPTRAELTSDKDEILAAIAALENLSAAEVTTELENALAAARSEPTGVPAANASLVTKIGVLYMALRNRIDVTSTKKTFYDDGGVAEFEKDLSDDGTTYTETEVNAI